MISKRALIFEDDPIDQKIFRRLLDDTWNITFASSLKRGLTILEDDNYDVVVLDLDLEDTKGIETFKIFNEKYPLVPIVVASGIGNDCETGEAFRFGAQDYIKKKDLNFNFSSALINAIERQDIRKINVSERNKAKKDSQIKTNFISQFSHEIKNPLNAIVGNAKILEEVELEDKYKKILAGIINGTERLQRVFKDILDFSKIESGNLFIEKSWFNLKQLIEKTILLYSGEASKKNILLMCYFDNNVPEEIEADPDRIQQILSNYISNAIKYTDQGAVVVNINCIDGKVIYEVFDTGRGLDDLQKKEVFKPYTQSFKKDMEVGTGLGLSIVFYLAKLMKGEIGIKDNKPNGAVFWYKQKVNVKNAKIKHSIDLSGFVICLSIELELVRETLEKLIMSMRGKVVYLNNSMNKIKKEFDCLIVDSKKSFKNQEDKEKIIILSAKEDAALTLSSFEKILSDILKIPLVNVESEKESSEIQSVFQGKTAAIIDDDEINGEVLQAFLKKNNIQAYIFNTSKKALESIQITRYNILFVDCLMPDIDGFTLVEKLRKEGNKTPVVYVSGIDKSSYQDRIQANKNCIFLEKPIDFDKLYDTLKKILYEKK